MTKKVLSLVLAVMIMLSGVVFADNQNTNNKSDFIGEKIVNEELQKELQSVFSSVNRGYKLKLKTNTNVKFEENFVQNIIGNTRAMSKYALRNEEKENTTPNESLYIAPNTGLNGEIKVENEIRWYVTSLPEKSKLTAIVDPDGNVDFDLYVYRLNQETSTLEFVKGSTLGVGESEKSDDVVDAGIYLFAVHGKSGVANFGLYIFNSTFDVNYEPNNTIPTAKLLSNGLNSTINAIIDNPTDVDVYKVEVPHKHTATISLTVPDNNKYLLVYSDGKNLYDIKTPYSFPQGTHYFLVYSSDGSYSQTKPYELKMKLLHNPNRELVASTKDLSVKLERTPGTEDYYVNGNRINISYNFEKAYSNSDGHYRTSMSLDSKSGTSVVSASFANFTTTWEGSHNKEKALVLSLEDVRAYVWRSSGGVYAGITMNDHFSSADVIIDPNNGNVIDMIYPNYFYMYGRRHYNLGDIETLYY